MKHTQAVREVAKFFSGLIAADLLTGFWLLAAGGLPGYFFGIWVTVPFALFWVGIDALVLLILVHYAWHPHALEPQISGKALFFIIGVITGVIAVVHFLRLVLGWPFVIGAWDIPMWLSGVGIIVSAYISYASFHFALRRGK